MKLNSEKQVVPFKFIEVYRPWGHFGLYAENEPCTCKILFIRAQESLSLQYHFKRAQTYILLDGNFEIEYSVKPIPEEIINNPNEYERFRDTEDFLLKNMHKEIGLEGDLFGFSQLTIHRAKYIGKREVGRILDIAYGENDELDIVRLQDNYGRRDTRKKY